MREQAPSDILQSNHVFTQNGEEEDTVWNPLAVQMLEIHAQEMLHPAAAERLARATSLPSGRRLYRLKCQWLCGLGRLLVVLGQRLQRVGLPPAGAMEERMITDRYIGL
jgi:hypothetical protein